MRDERTRGLWTVRLRVAAGCTRQPRVVCNGNPIIRSLLRGSERVGRVEGFMTHGVCIQRPPSPPARSARLWLRGLRAIEGVCICVCGVGLGPNKGMFEEPKRPNDVF
jgi:hypothetical protein